MDFAVYGIRSRSILKDGVLERFCRHDMSASAPTDTLFRWMLPYTFSGTDARYLLTANGLTTCGSALLKTEKQHSNDRAEMYRLIQNLTITMMTTANNDGGLTSRPMSPLLLDAYGDLWFFTDVRSDKVKHLDAINLGFTDASRATYVSLSGHGILHDERSYIDRLWTPFAKPWFAEGPESPNLVLLKFVTRSAEYWNSAQSRMVSLLATPETSISDMFDHPRKSMSA